MGARQRRDLRRIPGRRVREPIVEDVTPPDRVGQRAEHLLGRGRAVPHMGPIHVDIVGPQPAQRALEAGSDVARAVAAGERRSLFAREAGLRGENDAMPAAAICDEPAQHLLAPAARIDVRRVEKIAARVHIRVEHGARPLLVRSPAVGTEGHGAERQRADRQSGIAKRSIICQVHGVVSWSWTEIGARVDVD